MSKRLSSNCTKSLIHLGSHYMFRFTIRDMLWLTVVVAMSCVIFAQRSKIASMYLVIEHQEERLLYADYNIGELAKGWQRDRPDRVEFEDDYITVNSDDVRWSFGKPLRPK